MRERQSKDKDLREVAAVELEREGDLRPAKLKQTNSIRPGKTRYIVRGAPGCCAEHRLKGTEGQEGEQLGGSSIYPGGR